ncbi:MAG: hypothetical protein RBT67_07620 [Thauera sp.]|jgi:hypothetical protein|nr:hypothetical protein [Thauera sp.]
MQIQDPVLIDDIGLSIGATALLRLLALFGGTRLYVPENLNPDHVIARAIGIDAARALSARFSREHLELPDADDFTRLQRIRRVAGLLRAGMAPRDIAMLIGIGTRQVCRYRTEAEALGLIDVVFKQDPPAHPAAAHGRVNLRKVYLSSSAAASD